MGSWCSPCTGRWRAAPGRTSLRTAAARPSEAQVALTQQCSGRTGAAPSAGVAHWREAGVVFEDRRLACAAPRAAAGDATDAAPEAEVGADRLARSRHALQDVREGVEAGGHEAGAHDEPHCPIAVGRTHRPTKRLTEPAPARRIVMHQRRGTASVEQQKVGRALRQPSQRRPRRFARVPPPPTRRAVCCAVSPCPR